MFKGLEILTFAVEIEKNGEYFYKTISQLVKDAKAKEIFQELAAEESKHIGDFEKLMSSVSDYQPSESYDGEYMEYVKALVDEHVFKQNADVKALAQGAKDAKGAVELALKFEKDSIIFFNELRRLVSVHDQKTIDEIVTEEHKHVRTLVELKKEL